MFIHSLGYVSFFKSPLSLVAYGAEMMYLANLEAVFAVTMTLHPRHCVFAAATGRLTTRSTQLHHFLHKMKRVGDFSP